jgi:alpha-mannosidase
MGRRLSLGKVFLIAVCLATLTIGFLPAAPEAGRPGLWLAGYSRSVAGDTIRYHSSLPRANTALIVRATTGDKPVEWQTDPLPPTLSAPTVTFVWLAGMGTGKGGHAFDLSIDGRPGLTLTTTEGPSPLRREFFGPGGVSLVFRAALTDQFQEAFGPMMLTVPASLCRPGRPLTLRISGPRAASPDWIMVFQHRLEDRTTAEPEQALVRRNRGLYQPVRVEVERLGPPVEAEVGLPGTAKLRALVEPGGSAFDLAVPAVTASEDVSLDVRLEGAPPLVLPLKLRPVVRREFYLLPHSHNDIGYSDLQVKVEKDQWRYLEEGIALARKTESYPEGSRFKWNVEILWPIESYLAQASETKRREFVEAVKKGWVGLEAPLANELTGLMGPEEFFHLTDLGRRLVEAYGLPPLTTGMISDIPGSTWSLVPGLALAGVKYFSSGPNYVPFLPDGGDRIGFTSKGWGDKPFYWVSASGDKKVLFWMAGRGYSWFHGLNQGNLGESGEEPILEYAKELEENGYPYGLVQVRYTVGGDNGPPDPHLSDRVKAWNEKYESPRLVISTSRQLFQELEKRHGDAIPSFSGDMTPYWEDGAMSSARETILNQNAKDRLLQAEALWAMIDPAGFPAEAAYQGWRQALMFDEHTWGAWNSLSEPDAAEVKTQWDYKRAFAVEADRISGELIEGALRRSAARPAAGDPKTSPAIAVYNTSSWPRTDLVLVPAALSRSGDRVTDETGRPVASQRLSTGELAVLARDVPPLAAKRFLIHEGRAFAPAGAEAAGPALQSDRFRVTVDRASGAISSLVWRDRNVELVDGCRDMGLNDYFYVPGYDPRRAVRNPEPRITVKEPGPLVASLLIESEAPGAKSLTREVRIVQGLDRLDLVNTLDKTKVRTKESAHFAFPFRVPDGTIRVDVGWGVVRPGADQLAGACLDYLSVENWADVSGPDYGLTLAVPDAPLVEPGTITDETRNESGTRSWKKTWTGGTTLFSYILNNYWHTNYRSDQEGRMTFRYAVSPHGLFDAARARRFGIEVSQPLLVTAWPASAAAAGSLLEISPATVVATSVKPSQDGRAIMARLYGASGRPEKVQVRVPGHEEARVFLSDLLEEKVQPVYGPIDIPAFGIVTLRIEKH